MGSDLFAPWHIILLVVVLVVLFGAKRLPGAAQSLGRSMHIFKRSVQGLTDDDTDSAAKPFAADPTGSSWMTPAVAPPPPAADATQQQLADLQRQVADLQKQSAANNGQPSEAQTTRPI
jgi:sec-independent protein translocase protein TatA